MIKQIKKWIGSNYTISRYYHERRLRAESRKGEDPVIVFQMGKVGSTAIVDELRKRSLHTPVFHVHFLTNAGISDAKNRRAQLMKGYNANEWCLYESDFVRNYLGEHISDRKIKIITLFREPISRNISSFFYNIHKYVPDFDGYRLDDASCISELLHKYLEVFVEHEYTLEWFDAEFEPVFGLDLYKHEFDPEKGYSIIKNNGIEVLVLKLEKLKESASAAFSEFMNIEKFDLKKKNTSDEQPYYDTYKMFLANVNLPIAYIDMMYESAYMKHFYSEDEIMQFRRRWQHIA